MARGVKADNQLIANVMASYALTNSYNATAKQLKISDSTVKKIIMEHQEEFGKVQEQKKEEFADKANEIIDKAMILLKRRFDTALNNQDQIEKMIQMVFDAEEPEGEEKLTRKEKLDIVKRLSRLELNNLSEITTSLGTLFDKMRISRGETTDNNKVEVTIKVEE